MLLCHADRDCSWRIWVRTVLVTVNKKVLSTQIVLGICLWTPSVFMALICIHGGWVFEEIVRHDLVKELKTVDYN